MTLVRDDPEAGWQLRDRTPYPGPALLMVGRECTFGGGGGGEPRALTSFRSEPHQIGVGPG
jgi:hypothetical protein